jgi:hypothetical protein
MVGFLLALAQVVNGDNTGLALQPTLAQHPDGSVTVVWNSYRQGRERVFARTLGRPAVQLSAGPGVYYQPVVVPGWTFWMRRAGAGWEVVGRRLRDGVWEPLAVLGREALAPAAVEVGSRVVLAWEDHSRQPQRIQYRVWDGERWGEASVAGEGYRPALAATRQGEVWLFWDAYDGQEYGVWGARLGETGKRLSEPGRDCLKATAAPLGRSGVAVAWVSTRDVAGGGVLDHWDTVQVATFGDVADLRHGLLPRIEPKPSHMRGYAGRRRHPMLAADGDGVWLLWERKAIHDGPSDTTGQLCGRRYDGARWSDPVLLHEGLVDYRVGEVRGGRLTVLGKDIHHYYSIVEVDLAAGRPLPPPGDWPGWAPVRLPRGEAPARRSVEVDGKKYYLYWGDLHVHTELTPDAEGEVDEMIHWARDRARLDVLVNAENDANSWMNNNPQGAFRDHLLAQGEYEMGVYLARRYTEHGRFLVLPGWEWSSRTDDNRPNHRTVIFAGEDAPIVRHPENGNNFAELCDVVEAAGGVLLTQHEAYRLVKRPCDTNIEVASGWGVFINQPAKIHADLAAGFRVGFVATGDAHRRNPGAGGGLTGIYATELAPQAIVEALRERRVFATNGSRMALDARAHGKFMGQDVITDGPVELTLRVASPRPVVRAVLLRDGDEVHVARGPEARWVDRPSRGFHWYYWRVELEGASSQYPGNMKAAEGHLGWSSPHRVVVR